MQTLIDNRFRSKFAKDKAKRLHWSRNANAAKNRKRLERACEPVARPSERTGPLYTLTFVDHLIGKEYVFTLHRGKRINSYRVNVNGIPWKVCGWTDLMVEIRKKRVKIRRAR